MYNKLNELCYKATGASVPKSVLVDRLEDLEVENDD